MRKVEKVLLVADVIEDHSAQSLSTTTLEFAERGYLDGLVSGLNNAGFEVVHIDDPHRLKELSDGFKDQSVVLSIWSGEKSLSRRALVPSACEALGLRYVGADAYTSIVAQDKQLSKTYAARFGIWCAEEVLVSPGESLGSFASLKYPVVVKPLAEGGSIGIDQNSLCSDYQETLTQVKKLQEAQDGTVMVEEYLPGDEISICIVGPKSDPTLVATKAGVQGYDLAKGIWSMELKKMPGVVRENLPYTKQLDRQTTENCLRLFQSFEKVDYMRIDGRMTESGFRLIELTPDTHIGPEASFAQSFTMEGISYPQLLARIINLA